jgi:hypothetical protein
MGVQQCISEDKPVHKNSGTGVEKNNVSKKEINEKTYIAACSTLGTGGLGVP